jgi:hypothetical protein
LFGSFNGAEHDSATRVSRNRVVEPINVKVCMPFHKTQPTSKLDRKLKFGGLIEGAPKPKGKSKPGKFWPGGLKWEMENAVFFNISGTDG